MSEPHSASVLDIKFNIFDFQVLTPDGFEPGFYWNVWVPEHERASPNEVFLDGPYPTWQAALDAARDFITDAMTDYTAEIQNAA